MRKIWIAFIILLWSVAGFQILQGKASSEENKMIEVFNTFGGGEKISMVEYCGTYKNGFLPMEKREPLLKEIAGKLGIVSGLEIEKKEEEDRNEVILTKQAKSAKTTLRLITSKHGEKTEQYVIVNIRLEKGIESAMAHKKKINEILEQYTSDGRSSANVISSYDGKLSLEERNEKADEILGEMGARIVEEHRDMQLYTIYGYTTYISDYIMQEDQAVNVNIAMRYQETEEKTYVYIGIPVLGLDY